MRVGFVRKAGLGAMCLAMAALAACDDDPLDFDPQSAYSIFVNPNAMTLPAGGSQKLISRVEGQGGDPTFDQILVNGTQVAEETPVDVGCATVSLDPDALPIQPPGLFVVTGKGQLAECSFTLSSGSLERSVGVAVTSAGITMTLASPEPPIRAGDTGSIQATLVGADGNPVTPFDQTTDCTWDSNDTDIMTVDSTGAFTTLGPSGPVTISCVWESTVPGVPGDTIPQEIAREGLIDLSVVADFPVSAAFALGEDLGVVEVGTTSNFAVDVFDVYGNFNRLPTDILGVTASSADAGIATVTSGVRLDTIPDTDPPLVFATPVVQVTGVEVGNTTISGTVETVSGDLPFSATVAVLGAPPELTSLSVESGVPGDLVVITGTGFEPVMEVFIDGASIGGAGSISVEEITPTSVSFYWPIVDDGPHAITVGVFPLFSNSLTFTQTASLEADEPANDSDATTTTQITVGEAWVGAFGTGEFDDWIIVNIPAAGTYDFVVDWDVAGQDLDLLLYADGGGEAGGNICFSYYSKPEADCVGQNLAAGTYYVLIEDYSAGTGSPTNVNYRFTVD